MAAGSNTIEFRMVQTRASNGQIIGERLQVRTKDTLGALLGEWSDWQDLNATVVIEDIG